MNRFSTAKQIMRASPKQSIMLVGIMFMFFMLDLIMASQFRQTKNGRDTPLTVLAKIFFAAIIAMLTYMETLHTGAVPHVQWMLAGLLLCLAGDLAAGFHTAAGSVLFLLGHAAYTTGLLIRQPPGPTHAIAFLEAYALLIVFLLTYRRCIPGKWLFAGLCIYAAAPAALLAAGLLLVVTEGTLQAHFAAWGVLLLAISDMALCNTLFVARPAINRKASLGIYYTAQFLLGMSTLAVL